MQLKLKSNMLDCVSIWAKLPKSYELGYISNYNEELIKTEPLM